MTTKERPDSAAERITEEVTSWPGVQAGPGRRGEFAFTLGRRELGHLHGNHAFHGGFPRQVWQELFDKGRIDYHPVFPGKPGYGSRRIESEADVRDVIEMMRLNYDRAVARHGLPGGTGRRSRWRRGSRAAGLNAGATSVRTVAGHPRLPAAARAGQRARVQHQAWSRCGADRGSRRNLAPLPEPRTRGALRLELGDCAALRPRDRAPGRGRGLRHPRHLLASPPARRGLRGDPGSRPHRRGDRYLWDSGEHRLLFTGDTIYLDDGGWVAAVLETSDRAPTSRASS